jgi:hypothetical protein
VGGPLAERRRQATGPRTLAGELPLFDQNLTTAHLGGLRRSSGKRKARECSPFSMELAGLEPATSWVRFRRSRGQIWLA